MRTTPFPPMAADVGPCPKVSANGRARPPPTTGLRSPAASVRTRPEIEDRFPNEADQQERQDETRNLRHAPRSSTTEGDTADLHRCLWLVPMNASTRAATAESIGKLRAASGVDGEIPVAYIRRMIADPGDELKRAMNGRWSQVASDTRRALRTLRRSCVALADPASPVSRPHLLGCRDGGAVCASATTRPGAP